jgi:hypothetical protein
MRRLDGRAVTGRLIAARDGALLGAAGMRLTRWLVEQACPRWAGTGPLLVPAMGADGGARAAPLTLAGQGDMLCALALALRLGWAGHARVGQVLDLMLARGRRADGFFVHALGPDGMVAVAQGTPRDQAAMARAMVLGGMALGWDEVVAMGRDLRARMARCGMIATQPPGPERTGWPGQEAGRVLAALTRWQRLGAAQDAHVALAGVAGLEQACAMALPGLWHGPAGVAMGCDLWAFARVAAALQGEDRLWLYP